jgi:PAS domain S-box-containing protein
MIDILRTPHFDDDEKTMNAILLHRMLLTILGAGTILLSFVLILPEYSTRWVAAVGGFYLLGIPLLAINRRGHTRPASILLLSGLWVLITILVSTGNGIHSAGVVVYIVLIFMAGILLGGRAGIIAALLVSATMLVLTILEMSGNLPTTSIIHTPVSLWVLYTMLSTVVVYLQYAATDSIARSLEKARAELAVRTNIEQALRESEGRYRALVEHSPDAVMVVQKDRIVYHNAAAGRILKLPLLRSALGMSIEEIIAEESREFLRARRKQVMESGMSVPVAEWKLRCVDGSTVDVEGMGAPVVYDGAPAILNTFRDVTARKEATAALRASEDLISHTFEMSPDAIILSRLKDGKLLRWNRAFLEQMGRSGESLDGHSSVSLKVWKQEGERDTWIAELEKRGEVLDFETQLQRRDGTTRTVRVSARKIIVNGEEILLSIGRDSTDRNEMEQRLADSESKYRHLYENILEGFVSVDMEGRFVETNQAYLDMIGYRWEELAGLTYRDITPARWQQFEAGIVATEVLPRGYSRLYEKEYRRKDGSVLPVELRTYLVSGENGAPLGMWAIVRDVTERKQAEEELRIKDLALEYSINAIAISDLQGTLTYVNSAFLKIWGYRESGEALGKHIREFWILPEKAAEVFSGVPRGESRVGELTAVRKDGTTFIAEFSTKIVFSASGHPLFSLTAFIDITERKQAAAELLKAKDFAENLIQTADAIVVGLDRAGSVQLFNDAAERITGYSRKELKGRSWFETTVPHDRYPHVWEEFQRLPAGQLAREFENPILTKSGEERYIVWRNSELRENGEIAGSVSFGIDVTERKRIEQALRQSELRLRQVIDLVPQFIFAKNRKGQFILVNQAVAMAYGTTVDGLLGKTDADFNPDPVEVEHFLRDDNEVMDKGEEKEIPEESITDSTGRTRYLHTIKIPYRIAAGTEDAVLGVSTDITERKLAETTLRESEEQFRSLAEQSPNMIFINQAGRIIYANQRCEEVMGYTREEFTSASFDFRTLIVPESRARISESFSRHSKGEDVPPYEYGLLTNKGERIDAIITTKMINYRHAPAILGIVTDISDRKRSETELLISREQLRNLSNRLQAIREEESRRIAREIHDELGQALTALKMDLSALDEKILESPAQPDQAVIGKLASMSDLIDSAIRSVRRIGSELRPVALDSLGLIAAIEWQAGEFRQRTGIRCTWSLPGDDIEIDRERSTAIFRILQESLTNITRHAGASEVKISFSITDAALILRIEDNGRGMVRTDKLKEGSFGILGMRERASLFGGTIGIESTPGHGTILRATIPLDDGMRPVRNYTEKKPGA